MNPMQIKLAFQGNLTEFARDVHLAIAGGMRTAAERLAERAKLAYRGAVRQAGLGDRVANAVRVDIKPKSAAAHTHAPAVYVYTKAPKIIYAFSAGVTITGHNGLWLAIPTENVPGVGRGHRKLTPREVEQRFGQLLIFFPGRGGQMLGFVDVVAAKSGKGFRKAKRVRQKDGREKELVLMFVFVRQVRLNQRIDWQKATDDLSRDWVELCGSEVARRLAA